MAKTEVIDLTTFKKIVHELNDNSDFFDPIYLTADNFTGPLTRAESMFEPAAVVQMGSTHDIDPDEGWEVIDFLQSYSDVDLLAPSQLKKDTKSQLVFDDYIKDWYMMYLDEKTNPFLQD